MQIAAIIFLALLGLLTVFQLLLVSGAQLGRFAWGGQYNVLPAKLRVGSVVAVVVYVIFAVFIISKAELRNIIPTGLILDIGTWIIAGYLLLGTLANAASRSKSERLIMTPISLVLCVCAFIVAAT